MADKKISELDPAGTLTGTETLPIIQGGVNKRASIAQLASVAKATITKADIGLNLVDNTSDATKLAAAQAAITKTSLGLNNVDNTSDANKVISGPIADALGSKVNTSAMEVYATDIEVANAIAASNLRRSIQIDEYGAIGNGITNDSYIIQSAIDAMSTAGGGTILFSAKTYYIANELTPKIGVTLQGVTPRWSNNTNTIEGGTIFKGNITNDGISWCAKSTDPGTVLGTVDSTTAYYTKFYYGTCADAQNGTIQKHSMWYFNIKDIGFDDFKTAIKFGGLYQSGIFRSIFENILITNVNEWGIWLENSSQNIHRNIVVRNLKSTCTGAMWFGASHNGSSAFAHGNSIWDFLYAEVGNAAGPNGLVYNKRAIVFQVRAGGDFNQLDVRHALGVQASPENIQPANYLPYADLTNNSDIITVADNSIFALDAPVAFSASPGNTSSGFGAAARKTLFVLDKPAVGQIRLSNTQRGLPVTHTGANTAIASFTGSIVPGANNTGNLTTSGVSNTILIGHKVVGAQNGTVILSQTSGTSGGAGVYVVNISQTVPSVTSSRMGLVNLGFPCIEFSGLSKDNDVNTLNRDSQFASVTATSLDAEGCAGTSILVQNAQMHLQCESFSAPWLPDRYRYNNSNICVRGSRGTWSSTYPAFVDFNPGNDQWFTGGGAKITGWVNTAPQGIFYEYNEENSTGRNVLNFANSANDSKRTLVHQLDNGSGGFFTYPDTTIGQKTHYSSSTALAVSPSIGGSLIYVGTTNPGIWTLPQIITSTGGSLQGIGGAVAGTTTGLGFEIINNSAQPLTLNCNGTGGNKFGAADGTKTSLVILKGESVTVRAHWTNGNPNSFWAIIGDTRKVRDITTITAVGPTVLSHPVEVVYLDATSNSITITLPLANYHGVGASKTLRLKRIDSSPLNTVTIQRNPTPGTDTIDGDASFTMLPKDAFDLETDGVNLWSIF